MIEKLLVGTVCALTLIGLFTPHDEKWDKAKLVILGTGVVLGLITLILGENGLL